MIDGDGSRGHHVLRRGTTYIADHMEKDTRFEAGFLAATEEQVFHMIEESVPLIPSTLDPRERRIVTLLYLDFDNGEIGEQLGIQRKQVATLVRGIREKLADWAPDAAKPKAKSKAPLVVVPRPDPMPIAA